MAALNALSGLRNLYSFCGTLTYRPTVPDSAVVFSPPGNFNLQDAPMSIVNLDTNDIVRMFQVRATAELKRELDEVRSWEDRVRRGLVKREHVEGYIQASQSALSEQSGTF